MEIKDTYEFKQVQHLIDTIEYSTDPRINMAYHKGFLMAVLAKVCLYDNKAMHILKDTRAGLYEKGFKDRIGGGIRRPQA